MVLLKMLMEIALPKMGELLVMMMMMIFPLREGEIITIVITNDPLIGRGSISINIFTSTISSQTLVHVLYPIFVLKPQIGTYGLLVVLITPCS